MEEKKATKIQPSDSVSWHEAARRSKNAPLGRIPTEGNSRKLSKRNAYREEMREIQLKKMGYQ